MRMTRVALVLATAAVVTGGAVALWAVTGGEGDQDTAGTTSAGVAAATTGPPPFSTPTSAAPTSLAVEPGPDAPVATDAPVTGGGGSVDVVVTFADVEPSVAGVEVDGYVAGVVEDGGTCTLVLSQGALTAQASGPALPDASTTSCGALVVPLDGLEAGTWQAVLSYSSPTSSGSSTPAPIEVR